MQAYGHGDGSDGDDGDNVLPVGFMFPKCTSEWTHWWTNVWKEILLDVANFYIFYVYLYLNLIIGHVASTVMKVSASH